MDVEVHLGSRQLWNLIFPFLHISHVFRFFVPLVIIILAAAGLGGSGQDKTCNFPGSTSIVLFGERDLHSGFMLEHIQHRKMPGLNATNFARFTTQPTNVHCVWVEITKFLLSVLWGL